MVACGATVRSHSAAAWFYRRLNDDAVSEGGRIEVPTGFASSPHQMTMLNPPEIVVARNFDLVHYTKMPRGGPFAFWEQPEPMVTDVRQFFRTLRS